MDQELSQEQVEWLWYMAAIAAILPGIFILRFIVYTFLPRSVVKFFFKNKLGYKNENVLKKEKKFYED